MSLSFFQLYSKVDVSQVDRKKKLPKIGTEKFAAFTMCDYSIAIIDSTVLF